MTTVPCSGGPISVHTDRVNDRLMLFVGNEAAYLNLAQVAELTAVLARHADDIWGPDVPAPVIVDLP